MSGASAAGEPRSHRSEKRRERRELVEPYEPLWIFCKGAAVGGQAALRDLSPNGLGVTLAGRYARRLLQALRRTAAAAEAVEISCIPHDWHCRARVAWIEDTEHELTRIGFALVEPRGPRTRADPAD